MALKLLDLLDQLEEALPDLREQLGGGEGMEEEGEGELPPLPDEEGLPPMDEEEMPMEDEAPADLDAMPPMPPMKKKKPPFQPA